jgi:uncharacterized coiled-coil protein SlyX
MEQIDTLVAGMAALLTVAGGFVAGIYKARAEHTKVAGSVALDARRLEVQVEERLRAAQAEFVCQLTDRIDQLSGRVDDLERRLTEKDVLIVELRAAVVERDVALAQRDRQLAELREVTATQAARISELEQRVDHLLDELLNGQGGGQTQ